MPYIVGSFDFLSDFRELSFCGPCGPCLTNFSHWHFHKSKAIISETNIFGFKVGTLEYLFLSVTDASGYQDESEVEENDSEVINIVLLSP